MNATFKHTNNFARTLRSDRRQEDRPQTDPLFEADWDEVVIRFDEKRGEYVAKTAIQPMIEEAAEAIV